jgi:hypothetical protein
MAAVAAVTPLLQVLRSSGAPLQDRSERETVAIPLRVNTDDMYLGTFDVYLYFDLTVLSIDDPKAAVSFSPNTNQIESSILEF